MQSDSIFVIFDKIDNRLRMGVSVILIVLAFLFQLTTRNVFAGIPFILGCVILNFMKGFKVQQAKGGKLEWQEVTPEKIDQVLEHCQKIKKFRGMGIGCVIAVICAFVFFFFICTPITQEIFRPSFTLSIFIINTVILFAGLMIGGQKSAWMPRGLDIKGEIVNRLINAAIVKSDPLLLPVPYLEIGTTKEGSYPNDTRFMIRVKDAPADFIGLQGQISLNSVKSSLYPYFYVVLIAKREFKLFDKIGKPIFPKLLVERKETDEVDVIVLRQQTTKTSGYHTDVKVQEYILKSGIDLVKNILKA